MTQLSSDKDREIETCLVEFRRVPLKVGKVSFISLFDILLNQFLTCAGLPLCQQAVLTRQ